MLKLTSTATMKMCCCQAVCRDTVDFLLHYDT